MKEGSEQVAERESKSCLPRLVIQMPSSLATVNLILLLPNNTHKHSCTNQPNGATKTHAWLCSEQQERASSGRATKELHVVLHNPRRPADRQNDRGREREDRKTLA